MIRRPLFLALSLVPLLVARADTLKLKNGQEIAGEIISKDGDAVLIEYRVTATIKDQRSIPKSEIDKIETVAEDQKSFSELGPMTPLPTLLDATAYDSLLERKIPQFLKAYSYSSHLAEIREKQAVLAGERDRVRRGDRKIDGVWITSEEMSADPVQNGARVRLAQMKLAAAAGDPVASLQSYELLEKEFPGSDAMAEAVPFALKQLSQLQTKINAARSTYDINEKARLAALAAAPGDQKKEMNVLRERDLASAASAKQSAETTGAKFFAVFPGIKDSLDALQAIVNSEHDRLLTLSKTPMAESVADCAAAAKLLASGNAVAAKEKLASAEKLWPQCSAVAALRKKAGN
jgi:hypothetical protein